MSKKNKISILVVSIFLLLVVTISITYGFMGKKSEIINNINVIGTVIGSQDGINLSFSGNTTLDLNITLDKLYIINSSNEYDNYIENTANVKLTMTSDKNLYPEGVTCEYSIYYNPTTIYTPSSEAAANNLKEYTIKASNSKKVDVEIDAGNLSQKTKLFSSTITTGNINYKQEIDWNISGRFYNLSVDQESALGQHPSGTLTYEVGKCYVGASAAVICKNDTKMADCVEKMYTVDGENNIYLHDGKGSYINANLEADDNSYRYAGENPNNFVCFGSDAETCPEDNLYRIIGIFDGKTKLIKYDYALKALLGQDGDAKVGKGYRTEDRPTYKGTSTFVNIYYWNNSNNYDESNADATKSTNNWEESNLNKINLNTNYINGIGTTWSSMIDDTYWNTQKVKASGSIYTSNAKMAYSNLYNENYLKTSVASKVALMDVTDYFYAASPIHWSKAGNADDASHADLNGNYGEEYDYRSAINDNWIYMGLSEWTLTRTNSTSSAVYIYAEGKAGWTYVYDSAYAIRPVFYLKNDILYNSGDGTKTNPYRISM